MPTCRRSNLHNSVDAEAISAVQRAVVFVTQVYLCCLFYVSNYMRLTTQAIRHCFCIVDFANFSYRIDERTILTLQYTLVRTLSANTCTSLPIFLSVPDSLIAVSVSCNEGYMFVKNWNAEIFCLTM